MKPIVSMLIGAMIVMVSIMIFSNPVNGSGFRMYSFLSDSHASFRGEKAIDASGWGISKAGDVNGDGFDDILIGAYGNDDGGAEAGKTYLILGKSSGWTMDTDLSTADASFIGENAGDTSGRSVSEAGDVNGDGYDDILIGARRNGEGGTDAGQTYLILGKASGWVLDIDLSNADASFWGEDAGDNSGISVSGAGDVNGDGFDDIIIGAYENDDGGTNAGKTYLILGKSSGWTMDIDLSAADASFIGEDAEDWSGRSVSSAGDVNGDGFDDILIGACLNDDVGDMGGKTYLIFGKSSGWTMDIDLSAADASFIGEDAEDRSGISVSGAGDVNGDGYDDVIIGACYDEDGGTDAGQTYLILGKASGWKKVTNLMYADASFIGEDARELSGRSVSSAGDVNKDGFDDILIGAYASDYGKTNVGQSYLILGKSSGWTMDIDLSAADASFIGEDAEDRSGRTVSSAGDVNGDGFDDILIGANKDDDSFNDAGQTYLIFFESKPPKPYDVYIELSKEGDHIIISWNVTDYFKNLTGFNIYKSNDGMSYSLFESVSSVTFSFSDKDVVVSHYYRYKITSTSYPNLESEFSDSIEIMNDNDLDGDNIGDILDQDDDNDDYNDSDDMFSNNFSEWLDTDLDGIGNNADNDDDNDGIPDEKDDHPLNPINSIDKKIDDLLFKLNTIEYNYTKRLNSLEYNLISKLVGLNDTLQKEISKNLIQILSRIDEIPTGNGSLEKSIGGLEENLSSDLNDILGYLEMRFDLLRSYIEAINTTLSQEFNDTSNLSEINEAINNLSKLDDIIDNLERINDNLDVQQDNTHANADNSRVFFLTIIILMTLYTIIIGVLFFLWTISNKKRREE